MAFWKKIYGFLQSKDSSVAMPQGLPIAHGMLKREAEEEAAYLAWKSSPSKDKMLHYISRNYEVWKKKPCEQCDCIDFHKAAAFRGFIVHLADLGWDGGEIQHLMDYFKEQVLGSGYRVSLSDYKEFPKKRWVERREKHYLKPRLEYDSQERQIQRYGNVSIEGVFRDGDPIQLRFSACYYKDRSFTEPWDFSGLMESITV